MAKRYSKEIEELCGALRYEGLAIKEIMRRLNEDQAGLGYAVPIKERRVYEYVRTYTERYGPPPEDGDEDQTLDTIARLKRRALALLTREIAHYEDKRPGKVTPSDSVVLRHHFATLDSMELREEKAARRRGRSTSRSSSNDSEETESTIERLAREAREREEEGEGGADDEASENGREPTERLARSSSPTSLSTT